MRPATLLGLLCLGLAGPAAAQDDRCVFRIRNVDRTGTQAEVAPGIVNYYAGGNVSLYCEGTRITMFSDSVASYGLSRTVLFIGHVKYADSSVTMTADRGTYFRDNDRWEARGNVVTENLQNGSTITGPSLDYLREIKGKRDAAELYAVGRPTIRYVTLDDAGKPAEPYIIVADRVRLTGEDRVWAGGKVTIDRSDFAARSDSLRLDTGAGSDGTLLGGPPELRGQGTDSFTLKGRRIDLKLDHRELTYVTAKGDGHAVSRDLDLVADTIGLDIDHEKLVQTLAWGDSIRPRALSADYTILADSLAFDTPGGHLTQTRAFRRAWVASKEDSVTHDRDWLSGERIVADFALRDSAGTSRTSIRRITAVQHARSFYRLKDEKHPGRPALNYSRGDSIVVHLKTTGEEGVARVDLRGSVDGVQLEALDDSLARPSADSLGGRRKTP